MARGDLDTYAMQDPVYRWAWKVLGVTVGAVVVGAAVGLYLLLR